MNEANRLKLGGFLLISIALLVIGFISVGVGKLFEPRYRAMTVLNTSVEGLAVGSPVKYLGLPVGKITAMTRRTATSRFTSTFSRRRSNRTTISPETMRRAARTSRPSCARRI